MRRPLVKLWKSLEDASDKTEDMPVRRRTKDGWKVTFKGATHHARKLADAIKKAAAAIGS